ncbi:uncharacterized protein LOC143911363 isoform X2 [Arctopsyche grandis]|uniref:uncharacterized protein LOC143911363 isoform X2 n=1 Tax=Arctopsyche grandis TaxID=121162 RepID=UPI00406D97C9
MGVVYEKELKKIVQSKRSGCGADDIYIPSSSTFHELSFLANVEKPVLTMEDYSQQHQNEVVQKESLIYSSLNDDDEGPMPKITKNRPNKKNELLAQACTILSRPIVESPQTSFDLMCASWIESVKGLNPKLKLDTAHAINNLIYEAQTKNLYYTNNSSSLTYLSKSSPPVIHIPENASFNSPKIQVIEGLEPSTHITKRPPIIHIPKNIKYNPTGIRITEGLASKIFIKHQTTSHIKIII